MHRWKSAPACRFSISPGASQTTVSFITNYGHRLYSDDFVHPAGPVFRRGRFLREPDQSPRKSRSFSDTALDFPDEAFDGALVWDSLQYLSAPLLQIVVERLHRMLRPGACLLAFFHAEERVDTIPTYSYRISDHRTIQLAAARTAPTGAVFQQSQPGKTVSGFSVGEIFSDPRSLREVSSAGRIMSLAT